ncbi:GNAT family N-acetyltransferase [Pseudoalteromonas rhizosphaerae]|uniref:GNAT family N-acetyltransferase n=1 Tax=Pseudoalteromonas rhizosphaerae TaxID=2518973 RepID=UPI002147DA41|nr:GNAT family N-acetyltransferase [Pseudoalteromonas rhizosphaerae]
MIIRAAGIDDLAQLLELEQFVVDAERPYNASLKEGAVFYYDIEKLILCPDSHLLVVEVENEIVATGYAQIRDSKLSLEHTKHAYLGFMYVSPSYRGQSLNSKLIIELVNWSKSRGIFDFYLDVYAENDSAIKAYEKVGFKPALLEMKLCLDQLNT